MFPLLQYFVVFTVFTLFKRSEIDFDYLILLLDALVFFLKENAAVE